jgi:hypothetical protein
MKDPDYYFPFLAMKHGDSFVVPTNHPDIMRNVIIREARRSGVKVKTSCRVEDGILCIRCWKVEDDERPDA